MKAPWICAGLLALIHVLLVVVPVLAAHGSGEGQAFIVFLADFPLVWALQHAPGGGYILYNSVCAYISFFSVMGTVMYAAIGFLVGLLYRAIRMRKMAARWKWL